MVHRDLKPENIIIRKVRRGAEQIEVVDFGLAHIVGPGGTSITTPGLVCGTPDYMAPEQGRGEEVDGRGDLYAVGVVLFEMLTDRLPYEADTPTKVVFKHIHEPVPDPRQVAPHRAVPDELATICLKAMQKKAEDRFQSADEFYEVLREAEERLGHARTAAVTACVSCGAQNPAEQRFCGTCGARLTDCFTIPPSFRSSAPGRRSLPAASSSPLVGRAAEMERLMELRERAREAGVSVRLLGEAGSGKTRLLAELATLSSAEGDTVVVAGPHPSGAPVSYWPIRQLVRGLLDVDDAKLAQIAKSEGMGEPIARAGIAEMLEPRGLDGLPGESRAEAVAFALAAAVRVAAGRSRSGLVALLVDDLFRCDALSADVLRRVSARLSEGGVYLVTASIPQRDPLNADDTVKMLVRGLELREAGLFLAGEADSVDAAGAREKETAPSGRLLLPLYLEQLRALGVSGLESDETLPPRLADAVLARLERLELSARRLIQVISVFGDSAPLDWVREVSRGDDVSSLEALERDGLVRVENERVIVCHPFVRELIEASIPAEHRKELHAQALQVAADDGAPLEVRAEYAWRAAEPMSALLLLERMGDSALRRGDGSAAVLAFRRGLELARRELLLTGETSLDRAIVTFSRKLGDAMDWAGDAAGADGVLREALELAGPANRERVRMLLLLSRVAVKRNRQRDAMRLLGQALELSGRQGDRVSEAEAHLALGNLRLTDGDALTAANTLMKAVEIARGQKGTEPLLVEAWLARARALSLVGDSDGMRKDLDLARGAARQSGFAGLLARVVAAQAAALDPSTEGQRAVSYYREAAKLAADAGDAEGARRWQSLGHVSEPRQAG